MQKESVILRGFLRIFMPKITSFLSEGVPPDKKDSFSLPNIRCQHINIAKYESDRFIL